MKRLLRAGLVLVAGVGCAGAAAESWQFGGHLKYQYRYVDYAAGHMAANLGADPARDQALDLRLKADGRQGPWDFSIHYEALAVAGDTVASERRAAALGGGRIEPTGLPDDRRRLLNLTRGLSDGDRHVAVQRLDRLALGVGTGSTTWRFGRQVVTWGNGLVFQPMDFVNPFAPLALDKDYKTGDDMLLVQSALAARGEVQAIGVPRRDAVSHALAAREGTAATKLRLRALGADVDVVLARHYEDQILGLGVARSAGEAIWRMDLVRTALAAGGVRSAAVTNMDYSWSTFGLNTYGFVEYFHSGYGETDTPDYVAPNAALAVRLARGELYTLGRDYLALGGQLEPAPLWSLLATRIQNLNDGSRIVQLQLLHDWRQNVQWALGAAHPQGRAGSEYGGVATPAGHAGPGPAVFGRLGWYF